MFMKQRISPGRVLALLAALFFSGVAQTVAQDVVADGGWQLERILGQGSADDIVISPDGDTLAVAGSRGVWLYSLPRLRPITRLAPEHWVSKVYWSPDSQRLATISHGGFFYFRKNRPENDEGCSWHLSLVGQNPRSVHLWQASSGKLLQRLEYSAATDALAWSPSGHELVGTGDIAGGREADGTLRLWDAIVGTTISMLPGAQGRSETVAWSPDGKSVASIDMCGRLSLWNAFSGDRLFSTPPELQVNMLSWSPDGAHIALGDREGAFHILDARSGHILHTRNADHLDKGLAWSPDGNSIAVIGDKRTMLYHWGFGDFGFFASLDQEADVRAIAWSPDGSSIAAADESNLVKIWNFSEGVPVDLDYDSGVLDLALTPDCCFLVTRTLAGDITVRDVNSGATEGRIEGFTVPGHPVLSGNHRLSWWPNGQVLFASPGHPLFLPGEVFYPKGLVWRLAGEPENPVEEWEYDHFPSPDGTRRACICGDSVIILDNQTGRELFALKPEQSPGLINWSRDGTQLAVVTAGPSREAPSRIDVWRVTDRVNLISRFTARLGSGKAMDWSPDGGLLAIVSEIELPNGTFTATIRIYEVRVGALLTEFLARAGYVTSLAWSPDGDYLASGSNLSLTLWKPNSAYTDASVVWQTSANPDGSAVNDLAWSPDGNYIATANQSETNSFATTHPALVALFDAATGERLAQMTGHTGTINRVAWSPDGARLASTGLDFTVRIWRAPWAG
ncbi:MAG: WD40 repeat domain-containing protein [Anaerolineaceae bacterium]|nr:WD40 repeat domain-containing protein [Anaerolineaceae bacterium]